MNRLMGLMRSAMQKYNMIEQGDRIAVGVSGGKDSVALLYALAQMRKYYPQKYELVAISLDPGFNGVPMDFGPIMGLCEKIDVPYTIKQTQIAQIIFDYRKEPNPCSLCARMRRGALHDLTKELGCNKIALGHNLDDAVQTFYMNLLQGGSISCFQPVTYLSRKDLTLIRPLIFAYEKDTKRAVKNAGLPVIKSPCPVDKKTERERVKQLLYTLEKDYDRLRIKTIGAMQRAHISGW
ncbi:MAG TPA: tRNA 2-thiocytidine biosynthesis protein TtcA [Clostridiales bacterium]|nr:tRNA 2-thiocytidine biosynthesis protein TtcA [Clostridiales bacterium]